MKKVLIWDKNVKLTNSGGPAGYMWNIKQHLEAFPKEEVKFFSDILNVDISINRTIKHFHPIRIFLRILDKCGIPIAKQLMGIFFSVGNLTSTEMEKIKDFDYVHFHSIFMMNAYGNQIKSLGLKIILTTHTPEVMIDEIFSVFLRS